jgi:hypothetical protein
MAAAGLWQFKDYSPLMTVPTEYRYEKWCGWCEQRLPLHHFSPDKRMSDGKHSYCKACRAELKRMRWRRGSQRDVKSHFFAKSMLR